MNAEQRAEALRLADWVGNKQVENFLRALAADGQSEPVAWVGCGECDVSFPCHKGQAKCLRLNKPQHERTRSQKLTDAGFHKRPTLWAMEARQALELIATPMRPDGTWNRDRAACRQIAAEVLGRHDEEKL